MIEFYQAYATYHDLMDLTEKLFKGIATDVCGSATIQYQGGLISNTLSIPPTIKRLR
jgi:lysyl-tRNA synthetase class II